MKVLLTGTTAGTDPHGDADALSGASASAANPGVESPLDRGYSPTAVALAVLVVIAIVASLYLARAFFVPFLIGILASYALSPVVKWLEAIRVPRSVGAALVLAVLAGGLSSTVFLLGDNASAVINKLPEAARKLRQNLSAARASAPTAIQNMQDAADELQGAATDAGAKRGARTVVRQPEPATWLRDYVLAQSALLAPVVAQMPVVLLLTYFLLASGDHFRRKLVSFVGPSFSRKKDAVRILDEIDTQIQRYLLVTLVSNLLIAVCTWGAFELLGMQDAIVWGFAAGVLHFIPYLGPALIALASGMAGFLQFGSLLGALSVAAVSLGVSGAVGFLFTTWLQSRFAGVNAAVLFIALLFFGWLWGVWGLLLGAPLVAIAKVVCDHIESLKPAGELLGR